MVRRYSSASEADTETFGSNIRGFNRFGRRRSSSVSVKSVRIRRISRQLSVDEAEINEERLARLGNLMSAFYDDPDDVSSDQDSLIEELHDIGYLITPKDMDSETKTDNAIDEDVFMELGTRNVFKSTKHNKKTDFEMTRKRQ